jgi:hypothetical protein
VDGPVEVLFPDDPHWSTDGQRRAGRVRPCSAFRPVGTFHEVDLLNDVPGLRVPLDPQQRSARIGDGERATGIVDDLAEQVTADGQHQHQGMSVAVLSQLVLLQRHRRQSHAFSGHPDGHAAFPGECNERARGRVVDADQRHRLAVLHRTDDGRHLRAGMRRRRRIGLRHGTVPQGD